MKEFFEKKRLEAEEHQRAALAAGNAEKAEYFRGVAAGMKLAAVMMDD